ncbi:MAG: type VI secretion system lipoprotein TssJ [Pseudomonadota bacterium]
MFAICAIAILSGCGAASGVMKRKTQIDASIVAAADVNPNRASRPSPLSLYIYELKGATSFNRAGYFTLVSPEPGVLAGDVLNVTRLTIKPGETKALAVQAKDGASHIGVVAAFQRESGAVWRGVYELQPGKKNAVLISAEGARISIEAAKKKSPLARFKGDG